MSSEVESFMDYLERQARMDKKEVVSSGDPRVKAILEEIWELHCRKNADCCGENSLSNFKYAEDFGVSAWKGAAIRMSDKWSLIRNLVKDETNRQVKDEDLDETIRDLAVYAIITLALRRTRKTCLTGTGVLPELVVKEEI